MELSDTQIAAEVEANLRACARFDGFARDEAAWDDIWEGLYALLASWKRDVREAFGLDPRRSSLFGDYPQLLRAACDPQQPVLYSPRFREFGLPVFDGGPALSVIDFDPWTGKALPPSVRDAYFAEAEKLLGREVGLLDDATGTLPKDFRGEVWWIERSL
jgi:hypothetical protein